MSFDQIVSSVVEKILIPFVVKSAEPMVTLLWKKAADGMIESPDTIKLKFSSDFKGNFFLMTVISCHNLFDIDDVLICKTLASDYKA